MSMTPLGYNRAAIKRLVDTASPERIEIAMERAAKMQSELGLTVYPIEVNGQMLYTIEAFALAASRAAYRVERRRNDELRLSLVVAGVLIAFSGGALIVSMVCR